MVNRDVWSGLTLNSDCANACEKQPIIDSCNYRYAK